MITLQYRRLPLVLTWIIVACAVLNNLSLFAIDEGVLRARVAKLTDVARYTTNGTEWRALALGDFLSSGSLIQTGEVNAKVDLELLPVSESEGKPSRAVRIIRIFSGSAVRLAKLEWAPTELNKRANLGLDLLNLKQILGVVPASSECNLRLSAALTVELIFKHSRPAASGETVFVYKPMVGKLILISGSLSVSVAGQEPIDVMAGQTFSVANRRVDELPANATEKKLWP